MGGHGCVCVWGRFRQYACVMICHARVSSGGGGGQYGKLTWGALQMFWKGKAQGSDICVRIISSYQKCQYLLGQALLGWKSTTEGGASVLHC